MVYATKTALLRFLVFSVCVCVRNMPCRSQFFASMVLKKELGNFLEAVA
jgi:hypothetical protein